MVNVSAFGTPRDHVVQLYEHDEDLTRSVGGYLHEAIDSGGVGIVVATPPHRRAFRACLVAHGVDLAHAHAMGRLVELDAAGTLARFQSRGRLWPDRFRAVIGSVIRRAGASASQVRVFGEMVALLWDGGDVSGAIELETHWNELARELPFSLMCGYPFASIGKAEPAERVETIEQMCRLHSTVLGRIPISPEADVYSRARVIRVGIDLPGFMAELDQDAMAFRVECARTGKTVAQVAQEIFRAVDSDEEAWTHAEAIAAWALLEASRE